MQQIRTSIGKVLGRLFGRRRRKLNPSDVDVIFSRDPPDATGAYSVGGGIGGYFFDATLRPVDSRNETGNRHISHLAVYDIDTWEELAAFDDGWTTLPVTKRVQECIGLIVTALHAPLHSKLPQD